MDHATATLVNKLRDLTPDYLRDTHVVLLPDFFLDHIVHLPAYQTIINDITRIYTQRGGNIPNITQNLQQGGNAANTALALARLGITSHLICTTNLFGTLFLNLYLKPHGVDLTKVKTNGDLAITTALEFQDTNANVMLSDPGSVKDFDYTSLTTDDLNSIANADLVAVVNWTLNQNGTSLAKHVFRHAADHNTTTFLDTGDPSHRTQDIPTLMNDVLTSPDLAILGVNENELTRYATYLKPDSTNNIADLAYILKHHLNARLDVHTAHIAYSLSTETTAVPTYHLSNLHRSTGSGDCWNAGNIFADLIGLTDPERLQFANALAARYLSQPNPLPPTLPDVISFLSRIPITLEESP